MTDELKASDSHVMKPRRMNYFTGQFLVAEDFEDEQAYHLDRRRRLNRALFGHGVRNGFKVSVQDGKLRVGAGSAVDRQGRELWLDEELTLNNLSLPAEGNYLLCMQFHDAEVAEKTYAPRGAKDDMSWTGATRRAETINFFLISDRTSAGKDDIVLVSVKSVKDGRVEIDEASRDISTAPLGARLSVNPSGHYVDMYYKDRLNAFIGADMERQSPDAVTFSGMSNRLHLSGDQDLYVLNKKGMVIGKEWGGDGSLKVQGPATLQQGLKLTGNLAIEKDADKYGNLTVQGVTTLKERLHVEQSADIDGLLTVKARINLGKDDKRQAFINGGGLKEQTLNIAALEVSHNPGNNEGKWPGPKLSSSERIHVSGDEELMLLNKKGVVIAKNWYPDSAESGSLEVHGLATFRNIVVHAPGPQYVSNKDDSWIAQKLAQDGEFLFFVEPGTGGHEGNFFIAWRAAGRIKIECLGGNWKK